MSPNVSPKAVEDARRLLVEILRGGIWHTTHPDRFARILVTGAIVPEPAALPEKDRWGTSQGREGWPFVRTLGGVSLFDFDGFDEDEYSKRCPISNWQEFVPFRERWGRSVWIKIDRAKLGTQFISGVDLLRRWKDSGAYRHRLMPLIEAANIGALSVENFEWAFVIGESCGTPETIWPHERGDCLSDLNNKNTDLAE